MSLSSDTSVSFESNSKQVDYRNLMNYSRATSITPIPKLTRSCIISLSGLYGPMVETTCIMVISV
jgi:hypothetical protein